ncbi:MAG TPA: hypothetical protein VII61_16925, partial [Ktedonobacteraceae bacterium]
LERPEMEKSLRDYHLFYSAKADLLRSAGRLQEAGDTYQQALNLCQNEREISFLRRRIAEVSQEPI